MAARALLNVASHNRLGPWVTVSVTLGLRPGEVSGLVWEAIDLEAKSIVVYQSLGWIRNIPALKPTKTGNTRTLGLPAVTVEALRRHKAAQAEERLLMVDRWPLKWTSLVFVSQAGTPLIPSNLRRLITGLAVEAGIEGEVGPYDMRHTATSLLSAAGHSAERLADLLGHKDTRMVHKHYRHPVTTSISVAADYWSQAAQGA